MNALSQEQAPDSQIHPASFLSFMSTLALRRSAGGEVVHRPTVDSDARLLDFPASATTIPGKLYKVCCLGQKTTYNGFKDFKIEICKVLGNGP